MKIPKLFDRDTPIKVVEKRKFWLIVPVFMVVMAIVMALVFQFAVDGREGVNVSMEFTGGYTMSVALGNRLTDDTFDDYINQIIEIAEGLSPEAGGEPYGLRVNRRDILRLGSGGDAAIRFGFRGIASPYGDERGETEFMEYINLRLVDEFTVLFAFVPSEVSVTDTGYRVVFSQSLPDIRLENGELQRGIFTDAASFAMQNGGIVLTSATVDEVVDGQPTIVNVVAVDSSADNIATINRAFRISDDFSGGATPSGLTTAAMGAEMLIYGILALILALVLMLVYIAFRFDLSGAIAAILGLLHDLIIMFAFMVIFNIEIGVVFIAALITVMGYSLNNTIVVQDRAREKTKGLAGKFYDPKRIANESVKETIFRSFITTATGLFPMIAIALIGFFGVPSIQIFALPIIIGLASGLYSSLTIVPSLWSMLKGRYLKRQLRLGRIKEDVPIEVVEKTAEPFSNNEQTVLKQ